jgi:predicted HD phosphohydrolase
MRHVIAACLLAGLALPAAAQPQAVVTEEMIERGLVNLGLMAGHAFQCTAEAERAAVQRQLLAFNADLMAQLGANAASLFDTAFGAGSAREMDRAFCTRSLAD